MNVNLTAKLSKETLKYIEHQHNLPFVCLQFYRHNCLNILSGSKCFCKQVKNQ